MAPRLRSTKHAAPLALLYKEVLQAPDLQSTILDTIGLHGVGLRGINRAWRAAVEERLEAWRVLRHVRSFGSSGDASGQLDRASDVTALPDGSVCVADTVNNRLQIFSRDFSEAPRCVGRRGGDLGQFYAPWGVASDGTAIFVADTCNHRVQKLRLADGEILGTVGKPGCTGVVGNDKGNLYFPKGLCVAGNA